MGASDLAAPVLTCWLPLLLFLVSPHSCSSFYFREYGVVKPDQPYLFVGEQLELYCNLTKLELLEDSTYLYFTHNGVNIPNDFLQVLTTRAVRLRYPVQQPSDGGHFVCWLRQERSNNPRTIGSQEVFADYKPVKVEDVKCIVYNWENMTCVWDLGTDYQHPEHISVSLVWTISGEQRDCPKGQITKESCTWTQSAEDIEDRFLPGHRYIMQVSVTNTRRQVTQRSQTFHVETSSLVKPSPVVGLRKLGKQSNATCLCLEWDHTDSVHDKLAIVMYTSQWNPSLNMEKWLYFTRGPREALICELTPFTQYTIRVAVRPLPRGGGDNQGQDGFTSDWMYTTQRTDPSVPEVSPEVCVGCFSYLPSGLINRRNVVVYWKHIPWSLRNSVIHRYELRYLSAAKDFILSNRSTTYPNNSLLLHNLAADFPYSLQLVAVTSQDKVSAHPSVITLLSSNDTPLGPGSVLVETDFHNNATWTGMFGLHWTDTEHSTDSFLVVWCQGDIATRMCQHHENNQVHWQEIASNITHYFIDVSNTSGGAGNPSDYIVGVARQTRSHTDIISSGIQWAECFYRHNSIPKYLPDNVQLSQVYQAGNLRVTWNYRPCDNMASDVFVSHFVIYYCVSSDTSSSRCKGAEHNRTVGRDARSLLLEGLEQGAYYKVSMAAASQWGTSTERSQAVFSKVLLQPQEDEPRDLSVIGVILAVVVVVILIVIGVCKLKRCFKKNDEKITSSFCDLPSLPADNTKPFKQDRPLPQVPAGTASSTCVTYSSGAGSLVMTDQQPQQSQRGAGSKHKSITSETSLLGHEEAGNEDDSRRRQKPGAIVMSERCRLLTEASDRTMMEPPESTTITTPSRYDSDSGAESRYSSEDHDYAWVDGGGSASGGSGEEAASDAQSVVKNPNRPSDLTAAHRPSPFYAPPPPPQGPKTDSSKPSAVQTAVTTVRSYKDMHAAPNAGTLSKSHTVQPPTQLSVAPDTALAVTGYVGSEESTLLRRPPGSRIRGYVSYMPGQSLPNPVDPYASTSVNSFSHPAPPSPAPPPAAGRDVGQSQVEIMSVRAPPRLSYVPQTAATYCGSSTGSYSDDSRWSGNGVAQRLDSRNSNGTGEPIYNPPWESSSLAPVVANNRPLSLHTLRQLPQHFFDSSLRVNEGPTTEL